MSLPDFSLQAELFSTAGLSARLFAQTDRYRLFGKLVYPALAAARASLEKCYCADNGRVAIEPVLMMGVSILQDLDGVPDRQAVEMLRYHAGWNFALNRQLGDPVFHPASLVNFRHRLSEHNQSALGFTTILDALEKAGLVSRQSRQRLDSTQMFGRVARMSRLDCVRESLRLALQEVQPLVKLERRPLFWLALWERYVDSQTDYRAGGETLARKLGEAGADSWQFLKWLGESQPASMAGGEKARLLARVFAEQFEIRAGDPTPVALEKVVLEQGQTPAGPNAVEPDEPAVNSVEIPARAENPPPPIKEPELFIQQPSQAPASESEKNAAPSVDPQATGQTRTSQTEPTAASAVAIQTKDKEQAAAPPSPNPVEPDQSTGHWVKVPIVESPLAPIKEPEPLIEKSSGTPTGASEENPTPSVDQAITGQTSKGQAALTAASAVVIRPKDKKQLASDRVQNPHDPEATYAVKGQGDKKKEHVGYKVQVAETVSQAALAPGEPTQNFIVGIVTHPAYQSDEAGAVKMEAEQASMGLDKPPVQYVDGAYVSAQELARAQAEGRELIGPAPAAADNNEGRFTTEKFQIDVEQRKAICPAGKLNTQCSRLVENQTGRVSFRFEWSTHCADCPLRQQCVAPKQKHRMLVVGEHHTALQARRQEQQTQVFKERMKHRNGIEGTQSELVRGHGLRHARYRGLAKAKLQNYIIGAACNVKRWLRREAWKIQQAVLAAQNQAATAVAG
jgi:hypothetical protein